MNGFIVFLTITLWSVYAIPKPLVHVKPKTVRIHLVKQVLKNNKKLSFEYASKLAYLAEATAKKYNVSPTLILAILAQESMYSMNAVNRKSKDYSIAQINIRTIQMMGFDKERLLKDLPYAMDCMGQVLFRFKLYHGQTDKLWWARYNTGIPDLKHKYAKLVSRYF